jgi:hypothetical protein
MRKHTAESKEFDDLMLALYGLSVLIELAVGNFVDVPSKKLLYTGP